MTGYFAAYKKAMQTTKVFAKAGLDNQ